MKTFDIFVYCGGKCGSSTMKKTFMENDYSTLHTHGDCEYSIRTNKEENIFDVIDFSCQSKDKVYFFDSYRTPIERKISSFFQNIHKLLPNYNKLKIEELIDFFNKNLVYSLEEYHPINELLKHYNIPLFDTFDFNKGYNIVEKDNKVIVKVLFKDTYKWNNIFSEILGKEIMIKNCNISKNKSYYKLYTEFKEKYKVPKLYLENVLVKDKEFKIYNTIQEQEEYIHYWTNKSY